MISCQSGDRTAIGNSLLLKLGFTQVMNYAGGFSDWQSKGLAISKD
jgi:hydroxyacylglutathione hydrolase